MQQFSEQQTLVDGYLKELDQNLGIGGLALDEHGLCVLNIEEKGRIRFEVPAESDFCYVASPLTFSPTETETRQRFLTLALTHNFFGRGTQNATLSIDADSGVLYLHTTLAIEHLDARTLENTFFNFLELSVSLKREFEQIMLQPVGETQEAGPTTTNTTDAAPAIQTHISSLSLAGSFA